MCHFQDRLGGEKYEKLGEIASQAVSKFGTFKGTHTEPLLLREGSRE